MGNQEDFFIWTPHQAFYIQSMLFNTVSALASCDEASEYVKAISEGKIGPQDRKDELLDCLQNLVNQAGAISRYFFPSSEDPRKAAPKQKGMHGKRGSYLRKVFAVGDDSPLKNRGLRNSVEHFDERLDLYLEDGIVGHIFPSLILAEPKETEVPHHIFRAYYLREGIFQVLGERYELQPIVDEVGRVHDLLVKFDKNGGVFTEQ